MGPIPKENLQFHFEFGGHANRKDAAGIKKTLERLKPHVFVMEEALMTRDERIDAIKTVNRLARASKTDPERKKFLRGISEDRSIFGHGEFKVMEFVHAIHSGLTIFFVEEMGEEERNEAFWSLPWLVRFNPKIMDLLREGRVTEAMSLSEASFRETTGALVSSRDPVIACGIERMRFELPELFPERDWSGEVRVLARYGSMHGAAGAMLSARGYEVESDFVCRGIAEELSMALSLDPNIEFSPEQKAQILFMDVSQQIFPLVQDSASADSETLSQNYRALGAEGFFAILHELAGRRMDEATFKSALREALQTARESAEISAFAGNP
ncbi:MAG: hypothetical protein AB1324_05495 [Candidatus Micrarchaeota archaeon]